MLVWLSNRVSDYAIKVFSILMRLDFHKSSGKFYIYPSVRVDNPKCISIQDGVTLYRRGWIYAIKTGGGSPFIKIKRGTKIHDNFHITCSGSLEIGENCLINRNVLITDTIHEYKDINVPIIRQAIKNRETSVGDGCWIGNNSVIICSQIGNNSVVSANTVIVNKVIPDYCVVAGNPGKVIKQFDQVLNKWIKIN